MTALMFRLSVADRELFNNVGGALMWLRLEGHHRLVALYFSGQIVGIEA
jgi:hypothetical protein